jgi:predicted transcriptional regulator
MDDPQILNRSAETDEERRKRLAHEARLIAEAEADAAAGRVIYGEAVSAWLESLGTDHELPRPQLPRADNKP